MRFLSARRPNTSVNATRLKRQQRAASAAQINHAGGAEVCVHAIRDAGLSLGLRLALLRAVALGCCADSHVRKFVADCLEKSANWS